MQISNSSWISDIRSNGSLSKHIDLTTKTGKTYTYEVAGDPIDFIQNVKDAESVGVFVNKCFKDETLTRVDVWLRNKGGFQLPPFFSKMYDKNLRPMFDGAVLMNEAATKDKAVMAALRSLQEQNWEFKSHPTGYWNISDKH